MKIISRKAAKAAGLQYYYTGKPCARNHIVERSVCNHGCVECERTRVRNHHPLYNTYNGMRTRCYNEEATNYEDYGGRGIYMCDRWIDPVNGFTNFLSDMGPRPTQFSLDRIDCDGIYEPANCRWTDAVTQMRNRRCTKIKGEDIPQIFELLDEGNTLASIARRYKCHRSSIRHVRINREKYIEQGLGSCTKAAA